MQWLHGVHGDMQQWWPVCLCVRGGDTERDGMSLVRGCMIVLVSLVAFSPTVVLGGSPHSDIDSTVMWTVQRPNAQPPCILASFEATFTLNSSLLPTTNKTSSTNFTLPTTNLTVTAGGHCSSVATKPQTLQLNYSSLTSVISLNVTFFTVKDGKGRTYWYSYGMDVNLKNVSLPWLNDPVNALLNGSSTMFEAPVGSSYSCNSLATVHLSRDPFSVFVTFSNVRIQAYTTANTFGHASICRRDIESATDKDDLLVPVVVGMCLLITVVITIIVYAARKVLKQTQYNSMD